MPGSSDDSAEMNSKLDWILGQLTTMNSRLNSHDHRIARTEMFQQGSNGKVNDEEETAKTAPQSPRRDCGHGRRSSGGGGGRGGGGDDDDGGGGRGGSGGRRYYCGDYGDGYYVHCRASPTSSFSIMAVSPIPCLCSTNATIICRGIRHSRRRPGWRLSIYTELRATGMSRCNVTYIVSWPCFVEYVNLRFGPPIHSNALGEIKALYRTGTVQEYQHRLPFADLGISFTPSLASARLPCCSCKSSSLGVL